MITSLMSSYRRSNQFSQPHTLPVTRVLQHWHANMERCVLQDLCNWQTQLSSHANRTYAACKEIA